MDNLLKIISTACLKHHDTCETSTNIEARRILKALKDNGYEITKHKMEITEPIDDLETRLARAEYQKNCNCYDYPPKSQSAGSPNYCSNCGQDL